MRIKVYTQREETVQTPPNNSNSHAIINEQIKIDQYHINKQTGFSYLDFFLLKDQNHDLILNQNIDDNKIIENDNIIEIENEKQENKDILENYLNTKFKKQ